jgi:hypothetical protein
MDFKQLQEFLMSEEFTDKELDKLNAIIGIRRGKAAVSEAVGKLGKNPPDAYVDLFYSRLANVLTQEISLRVSPPNVLRNTSPKIYRMMTAASAQLYSISQDWNPSGVRGRNFTIGVYHLYCRLVVEYLRKNNIPVALKTCLQHTDKFLGMVDDSFPGYIKAGTIRLVIGEQTQRV